jgi:adenylate cyclase
MSWFGRGRRIREQAREGAPGLSLVWRTFGGITALVVVANLVGELVVDLLLIALNSDATRHQRMVIAVVGGAYALAAIAFGAVMAFVLQGPTLRWLARGRRPTRDEARRALRNPLELAVLTGTMWFVGAVLMSFVGAAVHATGEQIFGLCGGLVLAGLTTAGVAYRIAETVGRPISAIALSVCPPTEALVLSLRVRMLLNWLLATGVPLLGIVLILGSPGSHIVGAGLFAAVVALALGAVAANALARSIGEPLRAMTGVLRRVARGDLDGSVPVEEVGEIGMLQRGMNEMLAGLRERERIRELFGRHVGPAVAQEAIAADGALRMGEQCDVVALFVDIVGSTALTHRTAPTELVAILNRFFARVVDAVERNGGLLNKFEGDAALCIFGAPVPLDDPYTAALRAARAIRDGVHADGEVQVGIGVAAGRVIAGNVGTPTRLEYTVIGDAVNEAARLTDQAKRVDGCVLASSVTVESSAPDEQRHWTGGRTIRLRGRERPTHTYLAPVTADVH